MKKIIAGVALAVAASASMAGHGPEGCGAGTLVFPNASSLPEHVMAATTNGLSGNQTFGMTSGTLGCEDAGGAKMTRAYMGENMEQLVSDAARGQGEALEALSALMGVEASDTVEFNKTLQANFEAIFVSADTTTENAYDSMIQVMAQSTTLAKYVG